MRYRVDKNQKLIVSFLRELGCTVLVLSQVGNGSPDLLVGFRGRNILMEVKNEGEELRSNQKKFIGEWKGNAYVVRTRHDALLALMMVGCDDELS